MHLLVEIWNNFLYIPLLNTLIWFYNDWGKENMGYAVILLTIALRVILLPLSIVSERNKLRYKTLDNKIVEAEKAYKKDRVLLKEKIRALLKQYKISPWAKTLVLGIQALVLVLLYQVFIHSITYTRLNVLYPFVDRPEIIYTNFYGFELGTRNLWWAVAVGAVLFIEIYLDQRRRKSQVTKNEQVYAILFPIMSVLALYALPMVKSLFILTTLAFSYMLSIFRVVFYPEEKEEH